MLRFLLTVFTFFPFLVFADERDGKLEIEKIAEGLYLHTSCMDLPGHAHYPSNGLVLTDKNDAYIIDTPWSEHDTRQLVQWLVAAGLTPKASISTHFHADRSSGITYLNRQKIATYASSLTNHLLAESGAAKAMNEFQETRYALAGGRIKAYYPGAGHSKDNIVIWLPTYKLLFGGCLLRELAAQDMGNTADGSLAQWAQSIQNVINEFADIDRVIPGHGASGDKTLLLHTQALARKARATQLQQASAK